ncbi:unnamed protein product [Urochloa humidicola]
MEAWRFGFDLPAAHKFDPTDADIVARYLLPRAVGFPNPYEQAIIDGDPYSCPPWELMRRYGHGESDHAFFFGPPRVPDPKKKAARAVAPGGGDDVGGTWDGQRSDATRLVLTRAGGDGGPSLEITFRRANLSYYHGPQKKKTSGWVMHEYQIIHPPHLSATVLSRVKITRDGKKKKKKQQAAGAGAGGGGRQVVPPGPDQPGPSNYYEQPVGGVMEDMGGGCYGGGGGGGGNYLYGGSGSGGDCFAAGDGGGSYGANGGVMGETVGYYGDSGNGYFNQDSGCYLNHGDNSGGGGGYCFDFGDGNSYDYEYHDAGNGG